MMNRRPISRKIWVFISSVVGILIPMSVSAARFPNAIEKKIVITGETAVLFAKLLGLSSSHLPSISLQLGRGDSWAVYLLKQDTKEKLWNDNNGSPSRYNKVEFLASPVPSLTISPYWLDLGTQLPETKIGYYSFGSPFISEKLDLNDPWTHLLQRLKKESGWSSNTGQPFQRCSTSLEDTELCIKVFSTKDYTNNNVSNGYRAVIMIHIKNR